MTQLAFAEKAILSSLDGLYELALGGSAVGTGLNTHPQYAEKVAVKIAQITGYPFRTLQQIYGFGGSRCGR